MFKIQRILAGTTLLVVLGFMMIVWANNGPTPQLTRGKAVQLRFTFASGDSANVIQFEGAAITVEKDGKKLSITPYLRDGGQVELRVFQAVQREGRETMEAVDTLLVGKGLTKLTRGDVPFSVQVLNADKKLPAAAFATPPRTCCATTCAGTQICGVCVCTDCGRCGPGWCDCAAP
jgi:hypothetical protein